jgi:putative selenate reductase
LARHRKHYREAAGPKSARPLPLFDCGQAPCVGAGQPSGCPIDQQIPSYLAQVAAGQLGAAFSTIVADNVLPSTTATICNHRCQSFCTRLDYDDPLQIRGAKKAAVVAAQAAYIEALGAQPALRSEARVLVIGAGAAGLAAASYLRRNGVDVVVRETREQPLGIVSQVIPDFRISDEQWGLDVALAKSWGVALEYGAPAAYDLAKLKEEYDFIVLATGAWREGLSPIALDGEQAVDALDFLARSRASGRRLSLGRQVVVIGGGDVAMDCARAAARNAGVEQVSVVYRRTRQQMPAQPEEIELAEADGVVFAELLAPVAYSGAVLTCDVMELTDADASGRRGVRVCQQAAAQLPADTIISAVGARVDSAAFAANGLALNDRGLPLVGENNESSMPGVYIAGDCKAGPATVVQAMADAKLAAADILRKLQLPVDFEQKKRPDEPSPGPDFEQKKGPDEPSLWPLWPEPSPRSHLGPQQSGASLTTLALRKGILAAATTDAATDSARCLGCDQLCELCVDVCPNRANVSVKLTASTCDAAAAPGSAPAAPACASPASSVLAPAPAALTCEDAAALAPAPSPLAQRPPLTEQILHLDALCNECGNCAIFCPTAGRPYRDKLTLFATEEDFRDSDNCGFLPLNAAADGNGEASPDLLPAPQDANGPASPGPQDSNGEASPRPQDGNSSASSRLLLRLQDGSVLEATTDDERIPAPIAALAKTVLKRYAYLLHQERK